VQDAAGEEEEEQWPERVAVVVVHGMQLTVWARRAVM